MNQNGITIFGNRDLLKIDPSKNDIVHRVEPSDRFDQMAWNFYKDCNLYWLLYEYSLLQVEVLFFPDDFGKKFEGRELRYPNRARVIMEILK